MPWEVRGSKRYLYRPQRVRGRPRRIYLGCGRVGEQAAAADAQRRLERETAARELAAEEARLREAEAPLAQLCTEVHILGRACLVAEGFHQHARGQWRRRRRGQEPTGRPHASADPDPQAADPPQDLGALAALLQSAEQGGHWALCELRWVFASSPGVWQAAADLAGRVEAGLIQRVSGQNLLLAECLRLHLRAMKDELAGPSPLPAESLLVQCVTATWTWVNYLGCLAAQADYSSAARVNLLVRLVSAAHRRHIAAVRMLMTLRRLSKPPPSSCGLAGRLDRTPPRPVAAARASPHQPDELTAAR
jgi:hypothetical protein